MKLYQVKIKVSIDTETYILADDEKSLKEYIEKHKDHNKADNEWACMLNEYLELENKKINNLNFKPTEIKQITEKKAVIWDMDCIPFSATEENYSNLSELKVYKGYFYV